MSLEKFIKKLKKFLKNRGAELKHIETQFRYDLVYSNVRVYFTYKDITLCNNVDNDRYIADLKEILDYLCTHIEININNISNVQNLHKGK